MYVMPTENKGGCVCVCVFLSVLPPRLAEVYVNFILKELFNFLLMGFVLAVV